MKPSLDQRMLTIKEEKQVAAKGRESKSRAPMTAPLLPSVAIPAPAPLGGRKGKRTTLGELFQSECEETTAQEKAGKDQDCASGQWLMKTPDLPRTPPSATTRSVSITAGRFSDAGPGSGQTKLHKFVHTFNRKVHPLSLASVKPTATSKSHRQMKNKMPSPIRCPELEEGDKAQLHPDSYYVIAMASPPAGATKECNRSCHCQSNAQPVVLGGCYSKANREHWIRTDAEYLVLEL